jgi:hypothetical protein
MNMNFIEVIGHSAFFLTAISFLLKDIVLLRSLAVVSSIVGVGYNYFGAGGPNFLPIFWLSVFAIINSVRVIGIFTEKMSIKFTEEEKELYDTVFQNFTPVEYMKLLRFSQWMDLDENRLLTTEGQTLDGIYLLFNGEVIIRRSGKEISRSRDGAFVGEMSFIEGRNAPASATVITSMRSRCVFWSKEDLRNFLHRNPAIDISLKHAFSVDLAKKLQSQI